MHTRRFLLLATAILGLLAAGWWAFSERTSTGEAPAPSASTDEKELSEGIANAINFYHMLRANPATGKLSFEAIRAAHLQASAEGGQGSTLEWEAMGPDNVGGRTRAILVDKDNPNVLYAGAVSGGIWKSTNGGVSWTRKTMNPGNSTVGMLIISSLAQAPNGDLYAGTGEAAFTRYSPDKASGFWGGGIWKSTDGGETWDHLPSTEATSAASPWIGVYKVKVTASGRVIAATEKGIRISDDGGETWSTPEGLSGFVNRVFTDLAVSADGNTIYAVSKSPVRLFKSTDGGSNFAVINPTDIFGTNANLVRGEVAIDVNNPNVVYFVGAGSNGQTYAMSKSTDGGSTWNVILPPGSSVDPILNGQGWYDLIVAVDPHDPDRIFYGGVRMVQRMKGTWLPAATHGSPSRNTYIHVDQHEITFDTKNNVMYIGNDGGIFASTTYKGSPNITYSSRNANYITTQFYGVAASPDGTIIGGTQDNGTLKIDPQSLTGKSAVRILGGDGFHAEISQLRPNVYIYETYFGGIVVSYDKGNDIPVPIEPPSTVNASFNTPFVLWETEHDTTLTFVQSITPQGDTIYRTIDTTIILSKLLVAGIDQLLIVNNILDKGKWQYYLIDYGASFHPMDIEVTADGKTVFVGGSASGGGVLYRIKGIDRPTSAVSERVTSRSSIVAGIALDPSDNNRGVITLANYTGNQPKVFKMTNALAPSASAITLTPIHGNGLPHMPIYDAVINMDDPQNIILATELGVWMTTDGGSSWTEENGGAMDRVPVYEIRQYKFHPWYGGPVLFLATHGLGIMRSTSLAPGVGIADVRTDQSSAFEIKAYPNPAVSQIVFTPTQRVRRAKAVLYNAQGQVVMQREVEGGPDRPIRWNIEDLPVGQYWMVIVEGEGRRGAVSFVKQ